MPKHKTPTTGTARRWQSIITTLDEECIAHVRMRHGHSSDTDVVRFSLRQQVYRDRTVGGSPQGTQLQIANSVGIRFGYPSAEDALHPTAPTRRISLWLRPADLYYMGLVQTRWGFAYAAEAVRLALRMQASNEGFCPESGWGG